LFLVSRKTLELELDAEVEKLKVRMSPVGSGSALSPTDELHLITAFNTLATSDDIALDPAARKNKIKELTTRISEVGGCFFV